VTTFRVLRTAKATLSRTFHLDEVATDATGNVVVTVLRGDGTVVHGPVNASGPGADHEYAYDFPGRDVLDELVVQWALNIGGDAIVLDQDVIQVVGGFYFSIAEARAADSTLASTAKYPTSRLVEVRAETEDECELMTGQAWVPRFARCVLSGRGRTWLELPHTMIRAVRSVRVGGTAFTVPELAKVGFDDQGLLTLPREWPAGGRNIVVEVEHGHDRPPVDIVRGARLRFKSLALEGQSALPDNAERRVVTTDQTSTTYRAPSEESTGLPAVDAIYRRHPSPRPGFG
jgi:hypothetical protein